MKYIVKLVRLFVGVLFVISGFVKLVDPKGTSYKLYDYFAQDVLNLPFLQDHVLPLAFVFVVAEVVLGVFLILGLYKKFTLSSLFGLIVFFSFLTFYSAFFDKVKDCGCFGDAIKLKPWESFYKDLVLLIAIILLIVNNKYIKPLFSFRINLSVAFILTLISIGIAYWGIERLPIIDFRPYAIGEDLKENIKDVKEPIIQVNYVLKNEVTNETRVIDSQEYIDKEWWKRKEWKMQSDLTTEEIIDEGIPARIHDFVIGDDEYTQDVLNKEDVYLIVNYDELTFEESSKIKDFIIELNKANREFYFLTSGDVDLYNDTYNMDGIALKTIIRSSPGVIHLNKGIVVGKWHWKQLPKIN